MKCFCLVWLIYFNFVSCNLGAKLNAAIGNTVQLTCSDYTGNNADWLKDNTKIDKLVTSNTRLKIQNTSLVIQDAVEDDSGLYLCVNDNNITLIDWQLNITNVGSTATATTTTRLSTKSPMTFDIKNELWFDDTSLPRNTILTTVIGSYIVLDCRGGSSLSPYIEWMKDSKPIIEASYRFSGINFKWRQQPWMLVLQDVLIADSGVYECNIGSRAINRKKTRKFYLVVDDIRPTSKPVITYFKPNNITAIVGSSIKLTCRATAKPMPYIKWERISYRYHSNQSQNLTYDKTSHDEHKHKVVMLNSTFTEIIEANYTKIIETLCVHRAFEDHITLTDLQYDGSSEYACVAFNDFGFVSKTGYLHVIPKPPPSSHELEILYYEKYGNDRTTSRIPLSVVIVLPICVLILIIVVFVYWNVQRDKSETPRRKLPTVPLHFVDRNGGTGNYTKHGGPMDKKVNGTYSDNMNGSVHIPKIVVHPLMRVDNTWDDSDPNGLSNTQKYKSLPHVSDSPKPISRNISKSHDQLQLGPNLLDNVNHGSSENDLEWDQEDLDLQLTLDHPHIEDEDGIITLL